MDERRAVKDIGNGRVGAYGILFGTPETPDLSEWKDFFTPDTDFWLKQIPARPMLYNHSMDPYLDGADALIGMWPEVKLDDVGVWLEGEIDKNHRYRDAILKLIDNDALSVSSDSVSYLVRRKEQKNGTHRVLQWPLVAASLTPMPAEPRLKPVETLKSIYADCGIDIPDDLEDPAERAAIERAENEKALKIARSRLEITRLRVLL